MEEFEYSITHNFKDYLLIYNYEASDEPEHPNHIEGMSWFISDPELTEILLWDDYDWVPVQDNKIINELMAIGRLDQTVKSVEHMILTELEELDG